MVQIGDQVWIRERRDVPWQKEWKVIELGVPNVWGYPYDVLVETPEGLSRQVAVTYEERGNVLILPVQVPEDLTQVLRRYPFLVAVRANIYPDTLRVLCTRCDAPIYTANRTTVVSALLFAEGAFYRDASSAFEDGITVECGCAGRLYEIELDDDEETR